MQADSVRAGGLRTCLFKVVIFGFAVIAYASAASANVINSNTVISSTDFSYENQDIVISNCTVTIDGPHAFQTLRIASGSTLTHSPATNGLNLTIAGTVQVEA